PGRPGNATGPLACGPCALAFCNDVIGHRICEEDGGAVRNDRHPAGGGPAVGRLAQVIATRSGKAAPEAEFVIEHREALIYALCQAAELEHGIMCQYLFAAFSLKQSAGEGLTGAELAATARWRRQIS